MVQKCKSTKTQWSLPCGNSHQQHALKGQKLLAQDCYVHKQLALKGQKLLAQDCYVHKQHALKGQKLLAQGNTLGIMAISNAPCKGNSFIYYQKF